jgi:hypothetical protein
VKEFDLSANFAKDSVHRNVAHGSVGNRTFGENGGSSGKREALKHSNEAGSDDGE